MQQPSITQILSERSFFDHHFYIHFPHHKPRRPPPHRIKSKPYIASRLESTSKTPFDASLDNNTLFISTLYPSSTGTTSPYFSSTTSSQSSLSSSLESEPECVWADPIRIKENPTRYQYLKSYLQQRHLSFQSALPLLNPITFYNSSCCASYSVSPLFHCNTVWNFSSQWRRYKQTKKLGMNESLFCFVKGVGPMWEDPVNQRGGRVLVHTVMMDDLFEWVLCAFVGGGLSDDGVVGIVVSRKQRGDRVEIWVDHRVTPETLPHFKNKLCHLLNSACHEEIWASRFKKHFHM